MFSRNNIITAILFLVLIFAGTWKLGTSPATWFDEGINLGIAKSLVTKGVFSLEVAPDTFVEERQFLITNNYPVLLPVALSLQLFGVNFTAGRIPMVLFLLLFATVAFLLVKKQYGKKSAILTLALIVTFLPLYGNGKDVQGEIPGLFYFLCALLLLPAEYHLRKLFFAGLFVGLAVATKPFFLIVPVALFVGEAMMHWTRFCHPRGSHPSPDCLRQSFGGQVGSSPRAGEQGDPGRNESCTRLDSCLRRNDNLKFWKRAGVLALGMVTPVALYLYTILPSFSWAGISSTLFYYGNSYASPDIGALIFRNILRFFTESTPLHFSLLFLGGAVFLYMKKRKGEAITQTEIILGVFTLLTLAFYVKTPGWYRYFFPAHVLLFLIFPVALSRVFSRNTALIAVAALFVIQSGMLISKRNDPLYNSDEVVRFSERILEKTPSGSDILFLNAPSSAFLISGRRSYQYLQVNNERHLGYASLINLEGKPFSSVVISEPLPETALVGLRETLNRDYQLLDTVGHLNLYTYK